MWVCGNKGAEAHFCNPTVRKTSEAQTTRKTELSWDKKSCSVHRFRKNNPTHDIMLPSEDEQQRGNY